MDREKLLKVLGIAKPCLATQSFVPVLTHFCFSKGKVSAYNGAQGVVVDTEVDLNCAVPGEVLYKLLNSYIASDVKLTQTENEVVVKATGSTSKVSVLPPSDFVFTLPEKLPAMKMAVTADILQGLSKCMISVNENPLLQNQYGIVMEVGKEHGVLYSTDNNRVSKYVMPDVKSDSPIKVLLPKLFCQLLVGIGKELIENANIYFGDDFVVADFGVVVLFSKIVTDIEFLDFEKVTAQYLAEAKTFSETPPQFLGILERSLILTAVGADTIVNLESDDKFVEVSTDGGYGTGRDEIELKAPVFKFKTKFDTKILRDAIGEVKELTFVQHGQSSVVLVGRDGNFIHMVSALGG
jgi:DNA polymerase III sliding clamp (beta) subunit (PCNA family)